MLYLLLVFPALAVIWMLVLARMGAVPEDQPAKGFRRQRPVPKAEAVGKPADPAE